ncbi:hypothetical protein PALB_1140 [Pseudoalteromonas luteoviolacea B = ATCC 29581]|nr:hypothetical protein PALB_1140 [Pseudoalteromonas luteoviolacea B = ATCC 29581]
MASHYHFTVNMPNNTNFTRSDALRPVDLSSSLCCMAAELTLY